ICRKKSLSLGRRILCDYMHFSQQNRTAAAERLMTLPDVVTARREASPRPSWAAIMTKAFALAARNHPEMRQIYLDFPWCHLGEYEEEIGSVIVSRRVGDEDVILLGQLPCPEEQSLAHLDAQLRRYQREPVESIRRFRRSLLIARMPQLLRR